MLHEQTICSAQTQHSRYSLKICMHAQQARAGFPCAWYLTRGAAPASPPNPCLQFVLKSQQDEVSRKKNFDGTWHPLSLVNKQDQTKPRQS